MGILQQKLTIKAKRATHLHPLISWLPSLLLVLLIIACTPTPENVQRSEQLPPIFPDYIDVTIPKNIAPLNFLLKGDFEAIEVKAEHTRLSPDSAITLQTTGNEAVFDIDEWRALTSKNGTIKVSVCALSNGQWTAFKPFSWEVVSDSIDPYLTYRLIEPDYEVYNNLEIRERCIENFDERNLSTYKLVGNRCMNCHTHSIQKPDLSMMYIRGEGGGAILNQNGQLRKLDIKVPAEKSQDGKGGTSVYFTFSPSGRYVCFSTNVIMPAFHADAHKRMEVYDSRSDVYVADLQTNTIIASPLLNDTTWLETFPAFSPDGRYIYYCTAPVVRLPQAIDSLQYSLVRIPFDETTGTIGNQVDTLFAANSKHPSPDIKRSVCHPRISPDGRYLLYTVARYGTFPIWHREADQQLMDLKTGHIDTLKVVNSMCCDTYHSWSSNSRWFVFASKRGDALYGRPYFCYIDRKGRAHKPFCLPQANPTFYNNFLKSFNVPDLGKKRMNFNAEDVQQTMKRDAEPFK